MSIAESLLETQNRSCEQTVFHAIPPSILKQMQYLEAQDAQDRQDGTTRPQRLRQIPPETGKFLTLLAAGAPPGAFIEIGTSAGYSTLWLTLACRQLGRRIVTYEVLPEKARLALQTFQRAEVEAWVELVEGDARRYLQQHPEIAFCFLDAEKEIYQECYEAVIPRLVPGGLLVADNAISHQQALQPMLEQALADERVDALILPIGRGELVCRKI